LIGNNVNTSSDYCQSIIYIGPDKIRKVIKEMIRIAKKAVILLGQHTEEERDTDSLRIHHSGPGKRNYAILLNQVISEHKLRFIKIPDRS
jgi:hypothetical protein